MSQNLTTVWLRLKYINYRVFDGAPAHINWRHDPIQLISIVFWVPFNFFDDRVFFSPISFLLCFLLSVCFAIYLLFPMPLPINWWVFLIIFLEKFSNISSHTDDCLNTKGNELNNFPFLYLINLSCFLCRLCPLGKKGLKIKFGIHMLINFIVHYTECIIKKCITHYDCM